MKSTVVKSGIASIIGACCIYAGTAGAAAIDLHTWTAESYPAVSGFNPGIWTVAPSGASVNQSVNGQPTFFYSDFNAFGTSVTGNIRAGTGDDDFIGFALGFHPGDSTNSAADYLLVSWKQGNQFFDFGAPSSSPGGNAASGLSVSRVTGIPDADEFWQHSNLAGTPAGSGLSEFARGTNLGNTGWAANTTYSFTFNFGPNDLEVFVNGVKELDISGVYNNGRMAFYNFSMANVTYSAFDVAPGPFLPTPEPETYAMLLAGLGVLGFVARRRKQQQASRRA